MIDYMHCMCVSYTDLILYGSINAESSNLTFIPHEKEREKEKERE